MTEAKLFKIGGSQAVRLPKAFRMSGDRVRISREGDRVVLEPIPAESGRSPEELRAWLTGVQEAFGPDFMRDDRDQPPPQERDWSKLD